MDQLHEELKELIPEPEDPNQAVAMDDSPDEDNHSQSDDFQSCESCGSSDRAESEGPRVPEDINEAEMLMSEQTQNNRDWQKEKNLINNLYRAGSHCDLDKDVDTTTESRPIISSQGAIKAQGRTSGERKDANEIKLIILTCQSDILKGPDKLTEVCFRSLLRGKKFKIAAQW